jgi:hypothetical protein
MASPDARSELPLKIPLILPRRSTMEYEKKADFQSPLPFPRH